MDTRSSNIDPEEIAKFSQLANQWWDTSGDCKPLHMMNPLRLEFIKQHTDLNNKKVLDLGCGGGILSESLAAEGAETTGIDASPEMIKVAKLHLYESKLSVDYLQTTIEDFVVQHQHSFDVITCMELLEHVPDPASILKACARLIKPTGYLFLSTVNRNIKSYLLAIVAAEYLLGLLPKGTHDYDHFVRPSELDKWARAAGFSLKSIRGITYQPFTQQYYFTDNVDVNYLVCYQN